MAYTRVNWEDLPSTNTPRNATNLNNMDAGIKENDERLNGTKPMGSIVVDDVNCKNIYDGTFEVGAYNQTTGGKATSSTQYRNVNPIPCKPNTTYTFSINGIKYTSNIRYFFYDINLNYLSSEASTTGNITTPSDCYYISYHSTGLKTDYPNGLSKAQIEANTDATNYVEYKQPVKITNVGVKENTTFYANDFKCKNMFDKSNIVAGYLSNAGNVVSNTQYSTSNYINVKGIGNITISGSSGNSENICFYDSSKTFISFISTGANATLTTSVPSNAYYCRITVKNTNLDLVQLEVGSEATPYTPYLEVATNVETIDISSYKTSNVSSVSRAFVQRVGHIYRFNILCDVSSVSSTGVTLFTGLPFTPAFITELNSVNANNVTVRCFYGSGEIKIASSQASTYFINGTMII